MTKLKELFDIWYNIKIAPSPRAEATKLKYQAFGALIEKHFPQDIDEIRPSTYQLAFNNLAQNMGYNYAKRLDRYIRKVLDFSRADGLIIKDFTTGLEIFAGVEKKQRTEKYIHSIRDYNRILDDLKARFNFDRSISPYYLYLLFQTGCRPAELLGLRWSEVNFKTSEISINDRISVQTLERVKAKTADSIRTIPVNAEAYKVFKEIKEYQAIMLDDHKMSNPENLVFFHWSCKRHLPTHSALKMNLDKTLNTLQISPKISLYGARHTRISVLLASGVEMAVVAKYAGHTNTRMIIETYGGLLEENKATGFEKIKKL